MLCYRGACSRPAHPCGYNRETHGLYCLGCARNINEASPALALFPLLRLADKVTAGGSYRRGRIVVRRSQIPEK